MAKKENDTSALQELKMAIRAQNICNLYFFHGEETFLQHHYLEQIKKLLLDELTESFNYHPPEPEYAPPSWAYFPPHRQIPGYQNFHCSGDGN